MTMNRFQMLGSCLSSAGSNETISRNLFSSTFSKWNRRVLSTDRSNRVSCSSTKIANDVLLEAATKAAKAGAAVDIILNLIP